MDATTILSKVHTVDFEGEKWVDAAVEWPKLPGNLQAASDKWARRFSKLRMATTRCRYAKFGNIDAVLDDPSVSCKKSVFVPWGTWKECICTAVDKSNAKSPSTAHTPPPGVTSGPRSKPEAQISGEHELRLDSVDLCVAEKFVYDGHVLPIRAYGVRTPEGFYLNYDDVTNAIAVRQDNMPDVIEIHTAHIGFEITKVISFDMLITLICLKAKTFPVAKQLKRWVVHVTFNAQLGNGQRVEPQVAFAMREGKFSRGMYGITEPDREVLYLLEVCSGMLAMSLFPDQVRDALPTGTAIENCFVAKPGFTLDEKDRVGSNRTRLKKIFPGCDPRPIHSAEFPGISAKGLGDLETSVFDQEFEGQRIEGIIHNGEEQRELYLFECIDAQTAKNSMNLHSHRYVRSAIASAESSARQHEVNRIKLEQQVTDVREASIRREEELKQEIVSVRTAALQVMPPETAKIISTFWGIATH